METGKKQRYEAYRQLDKFSAADLELVRLILRGGSVLDWRRLRFTVPEARAFCRVHRIDLDNPDDVAMVERIRDEAVTYLKETFDFPVPRPVRRASLIDLLLLASDISNRHRQLCACTVLKAMHVVNHFEAREARQALERTDQQVFNIAEQRIYRTVSQMMATQLPVVEFMGGRKQRASSFTKLLSKSNPLSAPLFDKMRFRIITAQRADVLPVVNFLARNLFPFNYALSGESYNTLIPFVEFCRKHQTLAALVDGLQIDTSLDEARQLISNQHTSSDFKVVHWVADLPLRVPNYQQAFSTDGVDPIPRPIVYARAELQILDRRSHRRNEGGEASHRSYKMRQLKTVSDRLKLGLRSSPSSEQR